MLLKSQHEQEIRSQLLGNRWSITQTKTASLGKGWKWQFVSLPNTRPCDQDGFQSQRSFRKPVTWYQAQLVLLFWRKPQFERNQRSAKGNKQLSNGEHNSSLNQLNHKACHNVASLIFIIVWNWRGIHEMVDWKWRIWARFSEVLWNRVVPQTSTKDNCKDYEIAVDTRFRHKYTGSKRQDLKIESSSW